MHILISSIIGEVESLDSISSFDLLDLVSRTSGLIGEIDYSGTHSGLR